MSLEFSNCPLVVSDPEILSGDPVFRGTRVPVHLIAAMLGQSSTEADILKAYPRITTEMVRLAPVYAQAYPIRGRPCSQPWRDRPPVVRAPEVGRVARYFWQIVCQAIWPGVMCILMAHQIK